MFTARLATLSCLVCVLFSTEKSVLAQKEGDIRLVGSTDKWQGRVEIFHNKTWGTICDDYWDINFANVVCKQLKWGEALEVYMTADFGKGTGPIHLDRLHCYGNESKILECDTKGWNHNYCTHDEDVGVACMHQSEIPPGGCSFDLDWCGYTNSKDDDFDWRRQAGATASYNTGPAHDHTTGNGSYIYIETSYPRVQGEMARVVSPSFTGAKCIEFYFIMKGKTVNELSVYIDDGLQRELVWQKKGQNRTWTQAHVPVADKYTGSIQVVFEGLVGVSYTGDIAIDDVTPKTTKCVLAPKDAKPEPINLSNITSTVRLVNGNVSSAGRIEVLHNGRWGTVCGSHFHLPSAKVVCRQLGYLDVETLVPCCLFGSGKGMIWLDNLHCEGREPALTMCPHKGWGMTSCQHSRDVGVICKTNMTLRDIRLAGSDNDYEGRVEVKIGGIWGTIMDYGWDIYDSTVFCRQLGFGGASSAYSSAHYGQGKGPIWFSSVKCQGNETELWKCNMTQHKIQWRPHWWWHWNFHKNDASAECYDIRLAGGKTSMEGRIEFRYLGVWGTVCNVAWDMNAAKVACRNLGFSNVVATKVNYTLKLKKPSSSIDPIVSGFRCQGNEAVLGLCSHYPLSSGKHSCTHDNDVTIVCSGPVVKPTNTPGIKNCNQCPGTCEKTIKHGGFCICGLGPTLADEQSKLCDATEGNEVSEAKFPELTWSKWNPDDFKSNLVTQLNKYCTMSKTCSNIVNGSKFEFEDIVILDGWPKFFQGDLNLKFIVLLPVVNSHGVFSRNDIATMASKQGNKLGGYNVVMTRKPITPSPPKARKGTNDTVKVVVPIVVVLVIVGMAVVVYIIYKKRSAFGNAGGHGSSAPRYLHLPQDGDHHEQDDPLLTMEDDDITTVHA